MAGDPVPGLNGSSRARRTLGVALAQFSACALVLCGTVVAVVVAGPRSPTWMLVLFPVVGVIWGVAGVVAWSRRPSNRVGPILTGGGVLWLTVGLGNSGLPALIAIGQILASTPLAVVVHLLLAFPSGRLPDFRSRMLVIATYGVALVLQAPLYLFASEAPPFDVLQVADRPELAQAGYWIQAGVGSAVLAGTALVLVGRLRAASASQRRVLAPLYGYGIAAVLGVPVMANILRPAVLSPVATAVLQLAVLSLVPVAFAGSILRGGFARTAEVEELAPWLGAQQGRRPDLREALAATLGDPSLELGFWVSPGYVDAAGEPIPLPAPGDSRDTVQLELAGTSVGVIIYDAAMVADAELVERAGRVIAIEADRQRLTAELRASRDELRRSRQRLVEAGDRQQRRLARDLHDGLQNRLVLLALEAQRAGAVDVRRGLEVVIDDLRSLVAGVMPPLLIERGLYAATEDLVTRIPLPIQLDLGSRPVSLPASVEQVAYFVVSEALTNAVKHARAQAISVRFRHTVGHLRLEVRDDGIGGATFEKGAGLRGIADRVDVAGGRLLVDSPDGCGTCIVAELPCAS